MKYDVIVSNYLEENTYFIINKNNVIIVDPGADFDLIDNYINSNNYNILCILITHYHFDHIRSLDKLINKYNIKVYDYKNIGAIKINDYEIDIIKTSGHTSDSVSYYFKDYSVMFTGDFLFKESIGRCDFENSSIDEMNKSLNYIKTFNQDITILPGHGDKSNLKHEFKYNYYLIRGI
jgi:hydroxyacylglutathione hydrolase